MKILDESGDHIQNGPKEVEPPSKPVATQGGFGASIWLTREIKIWQNNTVLKTLLREA